MANIRFTSDELDIDLTPFNPVINEFNSYFSDGVYSKYSFPIQIPFTLMPYSLRKYKSYNSSVIPEKIVGYVEYNGKVEDAILYIEKITGDFIELVIRYGEEKISTWDSFLSDLQLVMLDVENIYEHAQETITKNYPEVLYNFPMLRTNQYDNDNSNFEFFKGYYNNRVRSNEDLEFGFIKNYIEEGVVYNFNIIKSMPYLMYLLNQGFNEAGKILKGDILEDSNLKDLLIYSPKNLEIEDRPGIIQWDVNIIDRVWVGSGWGLPDAIWVSELVIETPGKYKIKLSHRNHDHYYYQLKLNGELIYDFHGIDTGGWRNAEFEFETLPGENILRWEMKDNKADDTVMKSTIIPLEIYDENGNEINYLSIRNSINISEQVPEKTFGDLVKFIKNTFNYSLTIKGKEVWMNKLESEIYNDEDVIDLSDFEIKNPEREKNEVRNFIFGYSDNGEDVFKPDDIFIDAAGYRTSDFTKTEETEELKIDAILCENNEFEDIQTGFSNYNQNDKFQIVRYKAIQLPSVNTTKKLEHLYTSNLYKNYWEKWFHFRLYSYKYKWVFRVHSNISKKWKSIKKIFAYNNKHITNEVRREFVNEDVEEFEIETYNLP